MNDTARPLLDIDDPAYDENPEWTEEDFARAKPADEMFPPHVVAALTRSRGSQTAPVKKQISLRLDQDVIAKFRATGPGWQARINAALRAVTP